MGILTMKLLLLMIVSLFFFSVKAQNFRLITDVQQHQLNGKVKNVKEIITYEASFLVLLILFSILLVRMVL